MKKLPFLFVFLFGVFNTVVACKCSLQTFENELKITDHIFVGKVEKKIGGKYTIRIIKEWSRRPIIRDNDTLSIIQEKSDCTLRWFEPDEVYLFYTQNNSIHNCSRTITFSQAKDVDRLDNNQEFQSSFYNSAPRT